MKTQTKPNRRYSAVLRQICELIPSHLVPKLARETKVDEKARTFTPWSHVVAMLYGHLSHALSLNDICDGLRLRCTAVRSIRGATVPAKNTLSHANKVRDCEMARELFWRTLESLQASFPGFHGRGQRAKLIRRFRRAIYIVDSTTIQLFANCMDWAKHRRRKAAAKLHLRMTLHSFMPSFAVVAEARHHDNARARELCAGLCDGEIVVFDKAYLDFEHLHDLTERGVCWVSRAKEDLSYDVVEVQEASSDKRIIRDEIIIAVGARSSKSYPGKLRRVTAIVECDGEPREMVFLSNNLEWAASSIVDLYGCRWSIETFFKEMKQTVQLVDFVGHSANAVKWQVWTALLVQLLLRFLAWQSSWAHSFSRLVTYIRAALWISNDLLEILESCGTAKGQYAWLDSPEQVWLPGFAVGQQTTN